MQFHCSPAWRAAESDRCSVCPFLDQSAALAVDHFTGSMDFETTPWGIMSEALQTANRFRRSRQERRDEMRYSRRRLPTVTFTEVGARS